MTKKAFFIITSILTLFLILYFIAEMTTAQLWSNILSPVNAFIASGILLISFIKSARKKMTRISLLSYAIACFIWSVSDVIWAVIDFTGRNPDLFSFLQITYFLSGFIILFSISMFAIKQFSKWNVIQLVIDVITIILLFCVFIWIVVLNKDTSLLKDMLQSDFTSIFSIITDLLICISILSWFLSVRAGKIPSYIRIISSGASLFALTDLTYYYTYFKELPTLESLIYFFYILSLSMIAFGALWTTCKDRDAFDISTLKNEGKRIRYIYLLAFPFLTVFLKLTDFIRSEVNIVDIVTYLILIALYMLLSRYVQLSTEYNRLLTSEKNNNKILEQRVAEQVEELTFLANQDTLTTLFNRRYFINCLDDGIHSKRENELLVVLLIDMDRFKTINDHFGHDVGDSVLLSLSNRLIEWNNYGATIARLGGDEFAIMFLGKHTLKDIEDFCSQIINICNKPIQCNGNELSVTISIGIALHSDDALDVNTIIKHADIAMYRAKSQGYNKYELYNAELYKGINDKTKIEILLSQADISKDFELFYQPQFSLPDKKLIGAEALLRWRTAEYSYIPPGIFIPVAEETNFIHKIGKWVLLKALSQAKSWNNTLPFPLKIGVNISPKQFNDIEFINSLKTLITGSHINAAWLDAEITENIMLGDGENIRTLFSLLKSSGISISIDDFGSGYSSLAYLTKYSFDRIKIDKSLIDNLSSFNDNGNNIVKAAISMAKSAGVLTIAEGVETHGQLDILTQLGCDQVQGYLLGRPVPVEVFEQRFLNL